MLKTDNKNSTTWIIAAEVDSVELVGRECPELTVSDGALGDQRVGQLSERRESKVRGLGRQPAPAGEQSLADQHVPAISED